MDVGFKMGVKGFRIQQNSGTAADSISDHRGRRHGTSVVNSVNFVFLRKMKRVPTVIALSKYGY